MKIYFAVVNFCTQSQIIGLLGDSRCCMLKDIKA